MILSCESVQTHSHLPITFIEAVQGIPVPHRGATPGPSLRSGVGHTGTPLWTRQFTLSHTCAHLGALILSCGPESSRALLSGHVSSRTVPRQAHTAHMTSCQRPVTHMVAVWSRRAHNGAPAPLHKPAAPCAITGGTRQSAAIACARAAAYQHPLPRAGRLCQGSWKAGPRRRRKRRQLNRRASRERAEPRHVYRRARGRSAST